RAGAGHRHPGGSHRLGGIPGRARGAGADAGLSRAVWSGAVGGGVTGTIMATTRRSGLALGMVLCGLLASAPALQAQKLMYRYLDENQAVVLDDHVPPEFVGKGYAVLSTDGRVIEEVPPALGPEERRAREAADTAAERERMWDESLLRRYSSVVDIEDARERALREIEAHMDIL